MTTKPKRTGQPQNELQREATAANWDKLRIVGAIGHLRHIVMQRVGGPCAVVLRMKLAEIEEELLQLLAEDTARRKQIIRLRRTQPQANCPVISWVDYEKSEAKAVNHFTARLREIQDGSSKS